MALLSTPVQTSRLLALPLEIRQMIWEQSYLASKAQDHSNKYRVEDFDLFQFGATVDGKERHWGATTMIALLRINRQIHIEATQVLCSRLDLFCDRSLEAVENLFDYALAKIPAAALPSLRTMTVRQSVDLYDGLEGTKEELEPIIKHKIESASRASAHIVSRLPGLRKIRILFESGQLRFKRDFYLSRIPGDDDHWAWLVLHALHPFHLVPEIEGEFSQHHLLKSRMPLDYSVFYTASRRIESGTWCSEPCLRCLGVTRNTKRVLILPTKQEGVESRCTDCLLTDQNAYSKAPYLCECSRHGRFVLRLSQE